MIPTREKLLSLGLLLLVFGVTGCGGEQSANGGPGGMPPMPVETALVEADGMSDEFRVVGSLAAEFEITVVAEIARQVVALPFDEGQELAKGALIARLDDSQLRAEAERADALVQQRQNVHDRVQTIVNENAGAPQDLDDAAADLAVAEANAKVARARLAKTRIAAPFRGMVGARQVSVGAYLRAGDAITELAQIDRLRVNFAVPELYLGRLAEGALIRVRTSAYPELKLQGKIDVIDPILDRSSRTARIVAVVENPSRRLRPGMSAEVTVILDARPQALTIPSEAIFFQGTQALVYVVGDESRISLAPLTLGTRDEGRVEVLGGLEAGQTIVRAGHQKLFPGATVMPVGTDGPPTPEEQGAGS